MITKNFKWIQYTYVIVVKQIYDPPYMRINVVISQSYMCLLKHIYDHPYMSIYCWYMMLIYVYDETHI